MTRQQIIDAFSCIDPDDSIADAVAMFILGIKDDEDASRDPDQLTRLPWGSHVQLHEINAIAVVDNDGFMVVLHLRDSHFAVASPPYEDRDTAQALADVIGEARSRLIPPAKIEWDDPTSEDRTIN